MKNKNGFIATSVMFSFFLVFILLSVLVLASYTHYNVLLNNLNGSILQDLNDNVISKKYANLTNVVSNGSINDSSNWNYNNSFFENNVTNSTYIRLKNGNSSSFSQMFNSNKKFHGNNRKIYVSFNLERSYLVTCENEDFQIILDTGYRSYNINRFTYNDERGFYTRTGKDLVCGNEFLNWTLYGAIITVNTDYKLNQSIEFEASNIRNTIGVMGINNIVVTDITNLYKEDTSDEEMLEYLIKKLPYFDNDYSLPKI